MSIEQFLSANPWSQAVQRDGKDIVEQPWGDETLILELKHLDEAAIARLGDLILFPSFSALYHRQSKRMEIIFTPFRQDDVEGRGFNFAFEGAQYACSFAEPSKAVLDLAKASRPVAAPTSTDYRNLRQFRQYLSVLQKRDEKADFDSVYNPVSFWVEVCEPDEQKLTRLFEHLNFFMAYFDTSSPAILIHEAAPAEVKAERVRYLWDSFPTDIRGTAIDPYLLGLWSSARHASDTFRKFIYYYQMLEYSAFYFLSEKSEKSVESILVAPETAAFPHRAWQRIQDVLANEKIEEGAKLIAVVKQNIDVDIVWKEIEANRALFERPLVFDGGYRIEPVISTSTDQNAFRVSGLEKLVNTIRQLRNALVHAREKRMSNVISATQRNHALVRPFIAPLRSIAMQVANSSDT